MRHALTLCLTLLATPALADYVTGLQPGGALALRSGPGTGFAKLGEMPEGTFVTVVEESGDWRRVDLGDGRWGWASARYLSPSRAAGPAPGAPSGGWQTYRNPRFGTVIDYPAGILTPQPAPQNDDGRRFLSQDGRAELIVSAHHNALDRSIADMQAQDRTRFDEITYAPLRDDWYVLSGYLGDEIFYRRVEVTGGIVHSFELYFPRDGRDRWDPIVDRMSRSFAQN